MEEITTLQHWDVTGNGIEHTQTVTVRQNYDPYSQWSNVPDTLQNVSKTITITRCGIEENSLIRVYEEIYTYNPTPGPGLPEWELWEKAYKTGVPDATGLVGSSVAKYYRYVIDPVEGEWWALNRTERGGALPRPTTNNKVLAVNKIGKHFSSTATDDASISALGEREQEYDAFGLTTITDVERAAAKLLAYCQRAHTATVDVPLQPFCVGDYVSWKGESWTVEQVTVDMRSWRTGLKLTRRASIADMSVSMLADAQDIGMAVAGLVEKKAKRLHNAARGQIIAQVDYETYQVHIQGEPADKVRIAKVEYQRGVALPDGKEVLLVRPTGKNVRWEIVTRRNEESTVISSVAGEEDWYIPITTSVVLGRDVFEPTDTMMLYVQNLNRAKVIEVSWGDEGSEVVRSYTRGSTYTDGRVVWDAAASNPEYQYYTSDTLTSGYNGLYLLRDIVAPLDPETEPVQECSGKIRLQGRLGEWSDWETFEYEFRTPQIGTLEYSLGTPYAGTTAADASTALVVDATFTVNVDFSPYLAGKWDIEYGYMDGGFVPLEWYASGTRTHFRLLNGSTPVALTGRFVWRFSEDGEDWHDTPTPLDSFVQVGNGTSWSDALEVVHGTSTSFNTFGEFSLLPGDGTNRLYDWFALEKNEDGSAEITIPLRLGYSGPGQYYQTSSTIYSFGPPYPGIASEYSPFAYTDAGYTWDDRGEVTT